MVDNIDAGEGSSQINRTSSKVIAFDLAPSDLAKIEEDRETSPRLIRTTFIDRLKRLKPHGSYSDESRRGGPGLDVFDQSILHLLEEKSRAGIEGYQLARVMDKLEKVPLSKAIEERIGYRPPAIAFRVDDWRQDEVMTQMDRLLDSGKAVYVKANKSSRAMSVVRISKNGDQYDIKEGDGHQLTVDDLKQYTLKKSIHNKGEDIFIAEEEIPIARTSDGKTWEIRLLPPMSMDYTFCKLGTEGSVVNNTAQGGDVIPSYEGVLADVVRAKYPDADQSRVTQIIKGFMTSAIQVAKQIKDLTDDFQIQVAGAIVKPEDIKDPSKYDALMKTCFSGNFLCVDTTGVWDEDGQLVPRIIEAQSSPGLAGLAEGVAESAYQENLRSLNGKLATLKAELK